MNIKVKYSRALEVADYVPAHKCSRRETYGSRCNKKVQVYFVEEKDLKKDATDQAKTTPRQTCKRKNAYDLSLEPPAKRKMINVFSGQKKLDAGLPFRGIPTDAGNLLLEHVNKRLCGLTDLQSTSSAEDDPNWTLEGKKSKSKNVRKSSKVSDASCVKSLNPLITKASGKSGIKNTTTPKYDVDSVVDSRECNASHTLYLPYNNYWLFECEGLHAGYYSEFENNIENTFPESFLWLLKECSRLLEMKTKDLYLQLVSVEKMYFSDTKPPSLKITR